METEARIAWGYHSLVLCCSTCIPAALQGSEGDKELLTQLVRYFKNNILTDLCHFWSAPPQAVVVTISTAHTFQLMSWSSYLLPGFCCTGYASRGRAPQKEGDTWSAVPKVQDRAEVGSVLTFPVPSLVYRYKHCRAEHRPANTVQGTNICI